MSDAKQMIIPYYEVKVRFNDRFHPRGDFHTYLYSFVSAASISRVSQAGRIYGLLYFPGSADGPFTNPGKAAG